MEDIKNQAEIALLGAVILEPEIIHNIYLEPKHFTDKRNKQVYDIMKGLAKEGMTIDPLTMMSKVNNNTELLRYIAYLSGSSPSAKNYKAYEKIVLEQHEKNRIREAAKMFTETQADEDLDTLINATKNMRTQALLDSTSLKEDMLDIYDSLYQDRGELNGAESYGYHEVDKLTGGIKAGELIVMAGRPSMGKTAFAINVGLNIAEKSYNQKQLHGKNKIHSAHVSIFSLEMPRKQLLQRIISNLGNLNGYKWQDPYRFFTAKEKNDTVQIQGFLSSMPLTIDDNSEITLSQIEEKIKAVKENHQPAKHILIIDYLGQMPRPNRNRPDIEIGDITTGLKRLAKKHAVAIILLSQLSRAVEQRQDKHPTLSDLRDSGSIEQDADVVMLLYREDYYDRNTDDGGTVEIMIAKNRNGSTGTIKLVFMKEYSKFIQIRALKKAR
ncbi:replicative DNA helicase [Listeria monocytogenes]